MALVAGEKLKLRKQETCLVAHSHLETKIPSEKWVTFQEKISNSIMRQ